MDNRRAGMVEISITAECFPDMKIWFGVSAGVFGMAS